MSDGNSWCTCRKNIGHGYNTNGCPVHDKRDQLGDVVTAKNEILYEQLLVIRDLKAKIAKYEVALQKCATSRSKFVRQVAEEALADE